MLAPRHPLLRLAEVPAYVWATFLLALLLFLLAWFTQASAPSNVVVIQQAQVRMLGAPVADDRSVSLPHIWDNARRDWSGRAVYTLTLPGNTGTDAWANEGLAVLLPRVSARFRLLLNGHELLSESWRQGAGYVDTGTHAHFVALPAALLVTERSVNRLQIEIQGEVLRSSGLGPVWVGPRDVLQHRHHELQIWQVKLTWMVAACAFMLGMLALLIWRHTDEALFGLLAGGLLTLTVRLLLSTPLFIPGPFWAWDYLHKLSFTWYCGFTYLFMAQLFLFGQRQVHRAVKAMMVAAPLWLLLVVAVGDYRLYRWWMGLIVVICVYALVKVLGRARWGMDATQRLMVVVATATLITGVRDFLVVQMGLPGDVDIRWMTPGSMVLMFAMGWVLMRRTTETVDETRLLNAKLARTVEEREQELQTALKRLQVAQTQRVLEAERRRLTRDMHDGLGSQLVHALHMVRRVDQPVDSGVVATMLSHALDELRLTLDSLEPMEGDLPAVLGTLRQRIEPALEAVGIELDWQVQPVPPVAGLEAQGVMHLFRALQEVFANIVKHAHASRVTVRTWVQDGQVGLSVSDNGVGLGQSLGVRAVDSAPGGRGLGNIRLRAREMGAEVRFEDTRPGTCVSFLLPAERPAYGDPAVVQPQNLANTS
jgi:signal transduction histidine kinase